MSFAINIQSLKPITATIPTVASRLNISDKLGALQVRWGINRDNYKVTPGMYKVGNPNSKSNVFVSANYKLSFDILRKNLDLLDAWILVIDTKGVNVWCAAGKGTFSTDNIIRSIKSTSLESIVTHRNIIVPQLGAVGVAAHIVKENTGFRVIYGPVRANDIKAFVEAGYKATTEMRRVYFPIIERAKLIPVDMMYGKYKLLLILAGIFFISGLDKTGFLFGKMLNTSLLPIINIVSAYLAGIVIAPLLLPYIPFRAFALKGAFWGGVVAVTLNVILQATLLDNIALTAMSIAIASFMTMNFTGSSTFTSLSGVKKEMKWAIPFQIAFATGGIVLFVISKLI
jgi:hypothetical protein